MKPNLDKVRKQLNIRMEINYIKHRKKLYLKNKKPRKLVILED